MRALVAPVTVVIPTIWLIVVIFSVVVTAVGIASVVVIVLPVAVVIVLLVIVLFIFTVIRLFLGRWRLDWWRRGDSWTPCRLSKRLERCCRPWCGLRSQWNKGRLLDWLGSLFLLRLRLALLALLALSLLPLLLLRRGLLFSLRISTTHIWGQLEFHINVSSIEVIRGAQFEANLVIDIKVYIIARKSRAHKVV